MPLKYHPEAGTIVICDFKGLKSPEMIKRRLALVLSKRLRRRGKLCTVIPFSTTEPPKIMPFHFKLHLDPVLPKPYKSPVQWVKADMLYTVSFERLSIPYIGKNLDGKRMYDARIIDSADFIKIKECVLHGLGMEHLVDYL